MALEIKEFVGDGNISQVGKKKKNVEKKTKKTETKKETKKNK